MGSSSLTIRQIFFLRAFQEVSDRGKKQQSPGHVGPSVGPWAGGGALPLTSGMAAVTQASHPAAWHHGYIISEAAGGKFEIKTYEQYRHILWRSAIQNSSVCCQS